MVRCSVDVDVDVDVDGTKETHLSGLGDTNISGLARLSLEEDAHSLLDLTSTDGGLEGCARAAGIHFVVRHILVFFLFFVCVCVCVSLFDQWVRKYVCCVVLRVCVISSPSTVPVSVAASGDS